MSEPGLDGLIDCYDKKKEQGAGHASIEKADCCKQHGLYAIDVSFL